MKHVKKSVLLGYTPSEMYELVTAVADYPQFLPWCQRVDVLEQHEAGLTARLHLSYARVRQAFTTRNTHERHSQAKSHSQVKIELVDGPFSALHGVWRFMHLPGPGASQAACKVEFEIHYEFSNLAFELLLSPVFDRITNTIVDSFVKRAEQVYGSR